MYVCICNAINDGSVQQAIAAGNHCVASVYAACGVAPQCGTCGELIQEMIDTHKSASIPSASVPEALVSA